MDPSVQMPTILNVTGGGVIPQNARQARSLLDSDKRLATEDEEMESNTSQQGDCLDFQFPTLG